MADLRKIQINIMNFADDDKSINKTVNNILLSATDAQLVTFGQAVAGFYDSSNYRFRHVSKIETSYLQGGES